jgi:hypothetical protein
MKNKEARGEVPGAALVPQYQPLHAPDGEIDPFAIFRSIDQSASLEFPPKLR